MISNSNLTVLSRNYDAGYTLDASFLLHKSAMLCQYLACQSFSPLQGSDLVGRNDLVDPVLAEIMQEEQSH